MMGLPQDIGFVSSFLSNLSLGLAGTPAATQFGNIAGFDIAAEAPLSALSDRTLASVIAQAVTDTFAGTSSATAPSFDLAQQIANLEAYAAANPFGGTGYGPIGSTPEGGLTGLGPNPGTGNIASDFANAVGAFGSVYGDAISDALSGLGGAPSEVDGMLGGNDWGGGDWGGDGGGGGGGDGGGGDDGGGGYCFVAGTPVLMADGSTLPIQDIEVGDAVATFAVGGDLIPGRVVALIRGTSAEVLEIELDEQTIRCTAPHRFLTQRGWVEAGDLILTDKLLSANGAESKRIISLTPCLHDELVYNLTMSPHPHYVAAGVRVHNEKHEGGYIDEGMYPRTGDEIKGRSEVMVPALEGEFVIKPEAVARYGLDFLESLNAGRLDGKQFEAEKDQPEEFVGGGVVPLAGGGKIAVGPGGGLDDLIPTSINGRRAAALSDGEFVIPADVVSMMGDGSSNAGARRLYDMVRQVRDVKTGTTQQARPLPVGEILKRSVGR
jgi:hypothetical protein